MNASSRFFGFCCLCLSVCTARSLSCLFGLLLSCLSVCMCAGAPAAQKGKSAPAGYAGAAPKDSDQKKRSERQGGSSSSGTSGVMGGLKAGFLTGGRPKTASASEKAASSRGQAPRSLHRSTSGSENSRSFWDLFSIKIRISYHIDIMIFSHVVFELLQTK